jgi:hypothetical protein
LLRQEAVSQLRDAISAIDEKFMLSERDFVAKARDIDNFDSTCELT